MIAKRAQQCGSAKDDCPACKVAGALHGIKNGAKMWCLFA